MNIQALGSPTTPVVEDRPRQSAEAISASIAPAGANTDSPTAPSRKQVEAAVAHINASMPPSSKSLEFTVDADSKQTVVKIIDSSTKEVVRQIPTVEALEIARSIDKMSGLLISQKA